MEQQIIESTSEKDTLSASLKALQSEMTAQAIEIKSLKNELSQTNEEKNHLAHELADRNQAFTELKTEYDTIYNLQNSLQRSKTEVERAFSELQQIVEEKKKAIQAMEIKFNQELVEKEVWIIMIQFRYAIFILHIVGNSLRMEEEALHSRRRIAASTQ